MPERHKKYLEWTPERIMDWAGRYGDSVKELAKVLMDRKNFPQQGYNSCLGIIRLEKYYSAPRLNSACKRALTYHSCSYNSVKRILEKKLDLVEENIADKEKIHHDNIRGKDYYALELVGGAK